MVSLKDRVKKLFHRDGSKATSSLPTASSMDVAPIVPPPTCHTTDPHESTAGEDQKSQQSVAASNAKDAPNAAVGPAADAPEQQVGMVEGPTLVKKEKAEGELSQEIWNRAFDDILVGEETEGLVKTYIHALRVYMDDGKPDDAEEASSEETQEAEVLAVLNDRSKRQAFMDVVVTVGQKRIKTAENVSNVIGTISNAILSTKPAVDFVTSSVPQAAPAAIPWAGACIGLQILSNPKKAFNSNRSGIAEVASSMDNYCALVRHLIGTANNPTVDASFEQVIERLGRMVVDLYKTILIYQMRSACSYYRNQIYNFLVQLGNFDDWPGLLQNVVDASAKLMAEWDKYNSARASEVRDQIADTTSKMEAQLVNIHQTLEAYIKQQNKTRMDKESEACLSHIHVVNPLDDMRRVEKSKEPLIEDVFTWVLTDANYTALTNWADPSSPECRLLWIKGEGGTGKTMLLIGIIRALSDKLARLSPSLAYFLFQSKGKSKDPLDSAPVALKCLMWMLLIQQPQLMSHVLTEFNRATEGHFMNIDTTDAMIRHFKTMLPDANRVYFVVDALDECDDDLDSVVELIATSLCVSDKVRWLVTSRPEVDLLTKVNDKVEVLKLDSNNIGTLSDLNIRNRKDRIDNYLEQKWSGRKKWRHGDTFDDIIIEKVSLAVREQAEDNLLWVSLVFKDLPKMQGKEAERSVKQYPSGLRELYEHKMTRIENQQENEDGELSHLKCCKDVLVLMSHSYRPLSLAEFKSLIPWLDITGLEDIIDDCSSFVLLKDGVVTLNHKSAGDYLKKNRSRLQGGNIQGDEDIGRLSLAAMSSRLEKNMYGLKQHGIIPTDMRPPKETPLAHIAYCCEFWAKHFCYGEGDVPRQLKVGTDDVQVLEFVEKWLLCWLEGLALLKNSLAGIEAIGILLRSVQVYVFLNNHRNEPNANCKSKPDKSPQLAAYLKDVERFVLSNASIVERAPLQVYASALVFTPTVSKIRTCYWEEKSSFIESAHGIKTNWDPFLLTLATHSQPIQSLDFSPDGSAIASASTDGTVVLWDAHTGAQRWTINYNPAIKSFPIKFSPDSKTLASAAAGINLLDAKTGSCRKTTNPAHFNTESFSLAFLPDARSIRSIGYPHQVRDWNIDTNVSESLFNCDGDEYVLSHDGATLATFNRCNMSSIFENWSNFTRSNLQLWDASTGDRKHILTQNHNVTNVAFYTNKDLSILASSLDDDTVHIWDTGTGNKKRILSHASSSFPPAMAFSPDGMTIAVSDDSHIRLWNHVEGSEKKTLQGHMSNVCALAYSSKGNTLASGDSHGKIKLWDAIGNTAEHSVETPTPALYKGGFNSVVFSPDHNTIASISSDMIHLWDVGKKTTKHILKANLWLKRLAFSPDGNTFVTISTNSLEFWNTETGECRVTFQLSIANFSPTGSMVAAVLQRFEIYKPKTVVDLWDTNTLTHRQISLNSYALGGFSSTVGGIALSCDCTRLVVASNTKVSKLELYNIAGGPDGTEVSLFKTLDLSNRLGWNSTIAFSTDGHNVVWEDLGNVAIWDIATTAPRQDKIANFSVKTSSQSSIRSIALSRDGAILALTRSNSHRVELWDPKTGGNTHNLDLECGILDLSFSDDGSYLKTNRGNLKIPVDSESSSPAPEFASLSVRNEWIVGDSGPLLWLPPIYRGDRVAVSNGVVALLDESDRLAVVYLDHLSKV